MTIDPLAVNGLSSDSAGNGARTSARIQQDDSRSFSNTLARRRAETRDAARADANARSRAAQSGPASGDSADTNTSRSTSAQANARADRSGDAQTSAGQDKAQSTAQNQTHRTASADTRSRRKHNSADETNNTKHVTRRRLTQLDVTAQAAKARPGQTHTGDAAIKPVKAESNRQAEDIATANGKGKGKAATEKKSPVDTKLASRGSDDKHSHLHKKSGSDKPSVDHAGKKSDSDKLPPGIAALTGQVPAESRADSASTPQRIGTNGKRSKASRLAQLKTQASKTQARHDQTKAQKAKLATDAFNTKTFLNAKTLQTVSNPDADQSNTSQAHLAAAQTAHTNAGSQQASVLTHAASQTVFGSGQANAPTPASFATAAPAATGTLQAPLGSQQWNQAIAQQSLRLSHAGGGKAEITLNPPSLGQLHISLNMAQHAQVHFASPHADVRTAVENALPQLREAFSDAGISLGDTSVGEHGQQQAGAEDDQGSGRNPGHPGLGDDAQPVEAPRITSIAGRTLAGGIDIFA